MSILPVGMCMPLKAIKVTKKLAPEWKPLSAMKRGQQETERQKHSYHNSRKFAVLASFAHLRRSRSSWILAALCFLTLRGKWTPLHTKSYQDKEEMGLAPSALHFRRGATWPDRAALL